MKNPRQTAPVENHRSLKKLLHLAVCSLGTACAATAGFGQTTTPQDTPISAIDWLSETLADPQEFTLDEPRTSTGAAVESISVQSLDAPNPDAAGLLPASVTGFPMALWGRAASADVIKQIYESPRTTIPALSSLRREILLAETRPPENGDGALLLARIDKLLDLGLLEDAHELMEALDVTSSEIFRRKFDVALLLGHETDACNDIRSSGGIALTYQVRVFCLARNGDWNAAVLTLNSADVLGELDPGEYDLIARFLDPEMFEGDPDLPIPSHPSPLVFRMFEAIGEPIPTRLLPRAFSHADLRGITGWKPRIEAAERLARIGAIADNRLLGIYTERQAAASGGVWDRVKIVQAFHAALQASNQAHVEEQLPQLWTMMQETGMQRPLSAIFAPALAEMLQPTDETNALSDRSRDLIWRISLLSGGYESLLPDYTPTDQSGLFLKSLTQGLPKHADPANARSLAIQDGFDGSTPSPADQAFLDQGRIGELLLIALARFQAGTEGDLSQITSGLRLLRSLGREDTARQAALQFLLMSQPGAVR